MSLIKCVECGKEFSDKADSCPNCGCPTEYVLEEIKANTEMDSGQDAESEKISEMNANRYEKSECQEGVDEQINKKEQLKKLYESKEAFNNEVVLHFQLYGEKIDVTRGMRNKVLFFRDSKKSKKSVKGNFKTLLKEIKNVDDVFNIVAPAYDDCLNEYVDVIFQIVEQYEEIDIDEFKRSVLDRCNDINDDILRERTDAFMRDISRIDVDNVARAKYEVYSRYPIKDIFKGCLNDVLNKIEEYIISELSIRGVFVQWENKQTEDICVVYEDYIKKYEDRECSLTELRKKIVEILSVDTYNKNYYKDMLKYQFVGGEKDNFIKICTFLGFEGICTQYHFPSSEEYIEDLEVARDYLYGRGVPRDANKAYSMLENNKEKYSDNSAYINELLKAYDSENIEETKELLLKKCELGDLNSANRLLSDYIDKEKIDDKIILYKEVSSYFPQHSFVQGYQRILSDIIETVEEDREKNKYFAMLGEPHDIDSLYVLAHYFEGADSEELWEKSANYYWEIAKNEYDDVAVNANILNNAETLREAFSAESDYRESINKRKIYALFNVFVLVENGIVGVKHDEKHLVMKKALLDKHDEIINKMRHLSKGYDITDSAVFFASYLYTTYELSNYMATADYAENHFRNELDTKINIDNPKGTENKIYTNYFKILSEAENSSINYDAEIESIIQMNHIKVFVNVAKFFLALKGNWFADLKSIIKKEVIDHYEVKFKAEEVLKLYDEEYEDESVLGQFEKSMNIINERGEELLDIYCATIDGEMKCYGVNQDGDFFSDVSTRNFLKEYRENFDARFYKSMVSDFYHDNRYPTCNRGTNYEYSVYGKKTRGTIVKKRKIIVEMQNDQIINPNVEYNYVGSCIHDGYNYADKCYVFFDTSLRVYYSFEKLCDYVMTDKYGDKSINKKRTLKKKICQQCGTILDVDVEFCFNCGMKTVSSTEVNMVEEEYFDELFKSISMRRYGYSKETGYEKLLEVIGNNPNICVQYEDGRVDWLLNKVIETTKDVNLVLHLIRLGANVNTVRDASNDLYQYTSSVLWDAISYSDDIRIIEELIAKGANINACRIMLYKDKDQVEMDSLFNYVIRNSKRVNPKIYNYIMDIFLGYKNEHSRVIYRKTDKEKTNVYTPFFDAIEHSKNEKIVHLLLKAGYDPNGIRYDTFSRPNMEISALNAAVIYGNAAIVKQLLKSKANPNESYRVLHQRRGDVRYSALADAMINNNDEAIDLLLKHNARLDETICLNGKMIELYNLGLDNKKISSKTMSNLKKHGWLK